MSTNCVSLIADLFLYCYERDFMSSLQKSKGFDLIDKFNDTSQYIDDIFTIDNLTFAEHIPDIYLRELQLNKANTSDKETSFLDLNIKVIGNNIHTSVYDKRDDFGFPIVNFPWLKLYCRYLYTRPCMINHIWGLKQLWLQVNGHAWFHLQRLRWPVRNGEIAKNSKWKYMSPAGFEPTPRQSTTGKLQRLRPLGHAG